MDHQSTPWREGQHCSKSAQNQLMYEQKRYPMVVEDFLCFWLCPHNESKLICKDVTYSSSLNWNDHYGSSHLAQLSSRKRVKKNPFQINLRYLGRWMWCDRNRNADMTSYKRQVCLLTSLDTSFIQRTLWVLFIKNYPIFCHSASINTYVLYIYREREIHCIFHTSLIHGNTYSSTQKLCSNLLLQSLPS